MMILLIESNEKKYSSTLKGWRILNKKYPNSYYRPDDCLNLFSVLPEKKVKKSKLYNWLIKQQKREDPIGDLANDILRDSSFPVESDSIQCIYKYA